MAGRWIGARVRAVAVLGAVVCVVLLQTVLCGVAVSMPGCCPVRADAGAGAVASPTSPASPAEAGGGPAVGGPAGVAVTHVDAHAGDPHVHGGPSDPHTGSAAHDHAEPTTASAGVVSVGASVAALVTAPVAAVVTEPVDAAAAVMAAVVASAPAPLDESNDVLGACLVALLLVLCAAALISRDTSTAAPPGDSRLPVTGAWRPLAAPRFLLCVLRA